jgi:hypothetical protein
MAIFTTWLAYEGKIGITENGEYYDMGIGVKLIREVHCGAIYYRAISSKKRYSWSKANRTKLRKKVEIIEMPF